MQVVSIQVDDLLILTCLSKPCADESSATTNHLCEEPSHVRLTQQDRVDILITPELVEHGIVGEAGSTIEEERVEFVSALDMVAEGLKHISQLCAITEEVDEEVFLHCADSELSLQSPQDSSVAWFPQADQRSLS